MEALCGVSTSTPPTVQYSPSLTWTSVPRTTIGGNNLRTPSTFSYTIPSVIPTSAKEVLIYALIHSGGALRGGQHVKIFTQEGSNRYEKYLYMFGYPQDAINTNSDNMWFPLPTNRRIMMTVSNDQGDNCKAELHAIGYR